MRNWNDIYELSGKIFHYLFHRLEEEADSSAEVPEGWPDELVKKLSVTSNVREGLQQQRKYDSRQAWRKLMRRRQSRRIRRWSVAASIIVLIATGMYWWTGNVTKLVSHVTLAEKILPGEKKAVLTLADGSVWNIQDSAMVIDYEGKCLRIDSVGLQVAAANRAGEQTEMTFHTLSVPRGGEFYLTLPDGTQVWLNAETVLRFPVRFADGERVVQLQGEAYFDVTSDPERPFRVKLGEGQINVLGTAFCVSAYSGESLSATLVRGSINFETQDGTRRIIRPSQRLTYNSRNNRISVEEVNTSVYTSWKDQIFCFEEQSLSEIMTVLSRWYDVNVVFETEELRQIKLSGTLDKYAEIESFLRLFEAGANVRFDIHQKNITVRKKR